MQASDVQKIPDVDENIPPKVTAAPETSNLRVQVEDVEGSVFTQPGEENGSLSDAYTFSTPAPNSGNREKEEKSRLSGFQSALTPILKYLNIGNRSPSSESLKHVFSTEKSSKSTGESAHHPSSDLPTIPSGKARGGKGAPLRLLELDCSPEITLLDVTSDLTVEMTTNESVLCESAPVTPKVGNENNTKTSAFKKPVEKISLNTNAKTDIPSGNKNSYLYSGMLEEYFPEITLLEVSRDSVLTPVGQMLSMDITQDASPSVVIINKAVSELSEETESSIQNEDLSSASVLSVKCVKENTLKMSLEVTEDITMSSVAENSKTLSEHGEQNEKPLESDQEALVAKPVNITDEINSPHETFVQCASLSTSGVDINLSSERVTSERDSVEVVNEKQPTSCDSDLASKVSQQNSEETDVSETGTLTVAQPSNVSASSDFNSTASVSCTENKTLDLPAASVDGPKRERESTEETQSATMKLPCIGNKNSPATKESNQQVVKNITFDRSLQKSSGSTTLGEDVTTSLHLQNNTFDCKPPSQQNATRTLSEISSSDSHNKILDKTSPPKVCSSTISLKDDSSEVASAEMPKQQVPSAAAEPHVNMEENTNNIFEVNPVLESVSGSGESEGRCYSESRPPVTDGLFDDLSHQSVEMENKPDAFNLDETLDLKADHVITSTPMPNCKINNDDKEQEEGKIISAQKKLYGDDPGAPADQAPLNIVCDRKTFFTQHAPKYLKPPSKVTSQLLKNKPGSKHQGHLEPGTSCLPMKRQRTQPEPVRNAAFQEPQATTGIPASYNLRSTTAASKLPSSGLQRPRVSGIPSVVQRAGPGPRPPSARSNTISSSSAENPCGSAAANAIRNEQGKKHQLTRGEALPVKKMKKTDTVMPSSITEAPALASNTTNKLKSMKQPTASQRSLPAKYQRNDAAVPSTETSKLCDVSSRGRIIKPSASQRALLTKPQTHGCVKCSALEEQLKEKTEEIQRLKEELLKYKTQEDC